MLVHLPAKVFTRLVVVPERLRLKFRWGCPLGLNLAILHIILFNCVLMHLKLKIQVVMSLLLKKNINLLRHRPYNFLGSKSDHFLMTIYLKYLSHFHFIFTLQVNGLLFICFYCQKFLYFDEYSFLLHFVKFYLAFMSFYWDEDDFHLLINFM